MTESNGGWGTALADAIVKDLRAQQARVPVAHVNNHLTCLTDQEVLVARTFSGSHYRLARWHGVVFISKWRGTRWSAWYQTELAEPGPREGLHSTRWVTTPLAQLGTRGWDWRPQT